MTFYAEYAWGPGVVGLFGLLVAFVIYFYLKKQSPGNAVMQEIAELIEQGAMAFLRREYTVLLPFLLVVAALLWFALGDSGPATAIAYVFGGLCSVAAGFLGMKAATKANVRTSEAARGEGQAKALRIAFNGGAVMGLSVAALGLIGIGSLSWLILDWANLEFVAFEEFKRFSEIIAGFAMYV